MLLLFFYGIKVDGESPVLDDQLQGYDDAFLKWDVNYTPKESLINDTIRLEFNNFVDGRDTSNLIKMYGVTDIPLSSLSVIYDFEKNCYSNESYGECAVRVCSDSYEFIPDNENPQNSFCRIPFKRERVCLTESPISGTPWIDGNLYLEDCSIPGFRLFEKDPHTLFFDGIANFDYSIITRDEYNQRDIADPTLLSVELRSNLDPQVSLKQIIPPRNWGGNTGRSITEIGRCARVRYAAHDSPDNIADDDLMFGLYRDMPSCVTNHTWVVAKTDVIHTDKTYDWTQDRGVLVAACLVMLAGFLCVIGGIIACFASCICGGATSTTRRGTGIVIVDSNKQETLPYTVPVTAPYAPATAEMVSIPTGNAVSIFQQAAA
jgi:hypothetical protein